MPCDRRHYLPILFAAVVLLAACAPLPASSPTAAPTLTPLPVTPTLTPTASTIPLTATPTVPACLRQPGQVLDGELDTALVPKPMRLKIYLPPCYTENTSQRYPVLYLLHGLSYDETQWVRLGAPQAADRLITSGDAPPFMIVMPYNYGSRQPTQDHFGDALVTQLVPYIDATYRTLADRGHRAVGGLSRGGGWAIHLGTRNWDVFGAFGGHSAAIFRTDAGTMSLKLRDIPADSRPRIYLDIGDADNQLRSVQEFENMLTDMDFEHEWHLYPGVHDEDYWHEHVGEYLQWYAQGWQSP